MNINIRNFFILSVIFFISLVGFNLFSGGEVAGRYQEITFSDFLKYVENKEVSEVIITDKLIKGRYTDGSSFFTYPIYYPELVNNLKDSGINFKVSQNVDWFQAIFDYLPSLLLISIAILGLRQVYSGNNRAMGFGRSKAKLISEKNIKYTFKDVAGIDEAKEELVEIVDFLRDPSKFQKLGGKIPKGCLLIGPPGTGKTLLAKAIAGEANVPFFSISGSDFVEMFVGVGASRVRDMFEQGKRNAPCIIFIDEIDAVGRSRFVGTGGGNDEREQTLNQMLVEMDGFEANEGVIIIAATNRPDVLDPALLRPGRFDRQITISNPDINGREKILTVHLQKIKTDSSIDVRSIAKGTPGFSGADLANLVNEAALLAARNNKKFVNIEDLEAAKDKVMMGVERKSMVMSPEEKELTAYHEAGHALVLLYTPASDPIHKATIIPRGRALGMVMHLPEKDRVSETREQMTSRIAVAMGGRVAEEVFAGHEKVTSGASSDIQMATRYARAMVTEWGLSEEMGPVYYGSSNDHYSYKAVISESTAQKIDLEVKKIVDNGYQTAKNIINKHRDKLDIIAKALLELETLTGEQINKLVKGESFSAKATEEENLEIKKKQDKNNDDEK